MPYIIAGLLVLAAAFTAAINVAYYVFAAVVSVVNAIAGEPVVYLYDQIAAEADAGITIRYEVVRQMVGTSGNADHQLHLEVVNRSRWSISSIRPICMLWFDDGGSARLWTTDRRPRTSLDDAGYVSTAVAAGQSISVTMETERVQIPYGTAVRRADCSFELSLPWWMWASEMRRHETSR